MDDPRRGACSFSEDTANSDSNLLHQAQSYKNSQDEDDVERVVIEAAYLDDVVISASSEEEICKLKRTFPKFLHSSEIISKTSVHTRATPNSSSRVHQYSKNTRRIRV